jgi:hypothetical protein
MSRSVLLFVLLFAYCELKSQNTFQQEVVPRQWVKQWLLLGPMPLKEHEDISKSGFHYPGFDTDYLAKAGGETNLKVKAGDAVKLKTGILHWKQVLVGESEIDLVKEVSKMAPALAYAYTEVSCSEEGIWLASLGTNDGGRLWVNGQQVWDYQSERGLKHDADQVPVFLSKGTNTILLKVEQRGNRWGFCFRFHPFSAKEALERGDFLYVTSGTVGKSMLTSKFTGNILDNLVQSVHLKVVDFSGREVLNETRHSDFRGTINLPGEDYKPYNADIELQLKNGEKLPYQLSFHSGKRTEYTLFTQGKSDYKIELAPNASESEQWAAKELQTALKEMSGVEIPITNSVGDSPKIVIGYNKEMGQLNGIAEPEVTDESFVYLNDGSDIYIFGGQLRGTMYGVFSFLENELGCRWYTPKVTVIPKREELKFDFYGHTEKPGIRVRNDFYFEAFDPVWAARNKMNGTLDFADVPRKQPGGVEGYWAVHTFYPLMPPEEFFDKQPEYYSLIDGKRIHERTQLCLSNPDVLRIITERISERMRKSPGFLIYDVSQNDWDNPCQCEKCQAIAKKYGGEPGILIWFVNQVAEAVENEFPDKFIGTLAYQYTRHAPENIRPRDNVVVRLCSIECCVAHDFECSANQSFLTDLQNWSAIAPHLYIWDYVVNFSNYLLPLPNFATLQPKIKSFQKNNAIGIMEQAAYQSRGGEFAELRAYLISKILWNPDCNTEDVVNDFFVGYYGRSGKYIRQYFDLLQSLVTPDNHFPYGISPQDEIFTPVFIDKAAILFAEAKKVADNEEILHRVELSELAILYLKCKQRPVLSRINGSYAKFCEIAEREQVTHYAERGEPHRKTFHLGVENAQE